MVAGTAVTWEVMVPVWAMVRGHVGINLIDIGGGFLSIPLYSNYRLLLMKERVRYLPVNNTPYMNFYDENSYNLGLMMEI